MARPGLEPGTPRFSDVRSKRSNPAKTPANKAGAGAAWQVRIPADSILSMGIRAMTAVSSPFSQVHSAFLVTHDWLRRTRAAGPVGVGAVRAMTEMDRPRVRGGS